MRAAILAFIILFTGSGIWAQQTGTVISQRLRLEQGFRHPPAATRPWVFWYWMNAAVSKEGVRADLVAMKKAGIGGAYLMPINDVTDPPLYTPVVRQLSPAWWEMVRYAMQEADSLDVKLAMHACDGFAVAGGPWITPELSMQKLVFSRVAVEGGTRVGMTLPQPDRFENYYRDIAVLAFPTPAAWEQSTRNIVPLVTTSTGVDAGFLVKEGTGESFKSADNCWIQYQFDRPFTCRSIVIHSVNNYQSQRLLVEVSDDGIHFRDLGRLIPPRHGWEDGDAPVTHTIPAVTARYFRFVYDKTGSEPGAEDLDAAKWKPSLKISGIGLSAMPAISGFEGKTGEVWRISSRTTRDVLPDSICIPTDEILDLSNKMDAAGRLVWTPPAGHWTVLRVGNTSTGHTNATGGGGKGLECDKFNPEAVRLQFDHWFGETILRAGPALAGRVLKIFHVDSWECGSQNWSPVFREAFKKHRGYDLLRWLPAMAGIPLGSADSSERFLHDVRQTITELVHDNFYMTLAGLAHEKGCSFSAESVAPTMTGDGMLHYAASDIPMGEFWLRSPTHDKPNDMLDAISGAHVYGKPIIQSEAFTELRLAWNEYPGMLKTLQDLNYALGINRMVFHVFTHNPWLDRKPGMTLGGVGNFFQRDQTWWLQGKAWIDYTQRCQWLLQQGRPVADVAVFTGEEIPRRAVLPERLVTTLPGLFGKARVLAERLRMVNAGEPTTKIPNGVVRSANMADPADLADPLHGYAYDSFNPDVLLRLGSVRQGRIVLPDGMRYALLVLPGWRPMSPNPGIMSAAVAQRLLQWVKAGAIIMIDTPATGSLGLKDASGDDAIVRNVYRELLQGPFTPVNGKDDGSFLWAAVGKGHVIRGPYEAASLEGIGLARDFSAKECTAASVSSPQESTASDETTRAAGIAYTHRVAPGLDIYFVSNQLSRPQELSVSLRVSGRVPELWDAVSGEISLAAGWSMHKGRTVLPLSLPANGSVFIVLRKPAARVRMGQSAGPAAVRHGQRSERPGSTAAVQPGSPAAMQSDSPMAVQTLSGPWTVQFDPSLGGPARPVVFEQLTDWSKNTDTAIRYYSGTAVYSRSFNWEDPQAGRLWLDLGRVENIAGVQLNGVDCGTAWTFPYRVDISKAIRRGRNELRISVTNTWANRLTGDQRLPEHQRITWTTAPYRLDGGLLPAGLVGEVRVMRER